MAFVTCSPKKSPFDTINTNSHPQQPQQLAHYYQQQSDTYTCTLARLHSKDKSILQHSRNQSKIKQLPKRQNKNKSNIQSCCSIPKQHLLYQYFNYEELLRKNAIRKQIKEMKKGVRSYFMGLEKQLCGDRFYQLPNSLSLKTMVKYPSPVKAITNKMQSIDSTYIEDSTILESPGPCSYSYHPKSTPNVPKFIQHHTKRLDSPSIQQNQSSKLPQIQQKLFAVKYQKMNSHFFKKSLNLTKQSNNKLLSKLFPEKSRKSTADQSHNTSQSEDQQYQHNVTYSPGPSDYNPKLSQNNIRQIFMSTEQRFPAAKYEHPIQANQYVLIKNSLQYHQQSNYVQEQINNNVNSANFCSKSNRFTEKQKDYRPIQYLKTQDSFIKRRFGRKYVPFDSNIGRNNQNQLKDQSNTLILETIAESQYEDRKGFMAKFDNFKQQRVLFDVKQSSLQPGPGSYSPQQWKYPTTGPLISPPPSNQHQQDPISQQSQFLHNLKIGSTPKHSPPKHSPKHKPTKPAKRISHSIANHSKQNNLPLSYLPLIDDENWLKRSYNRLFAYNYTLNANNPIQYIQYLN